MISNVNVSIALTLFMGIASGGLLALTLMATRRQQISFSFMLALTLLLATLGAISLAADTESLTAGLASGMVILVLSGALGYILTTYSVLSSASERGDIREPAERTGVTAVIILAQGEPPHYEVRSAARRFERADDRSDVPPPLLRPFYMRDLKGKYVDIGRSPSREYYFQLAAKVQSRLDSSHRVYPAFYSDSPTYKEAVCEAIEDGARRIIVAQARTSDPPDMVRSGELLDRVRLESRKIELIQLEPLWDGELLPQIYVRQVMEAAAQNPDRTEESGLLLIGRGHPVTSESSERRMEQEEAFLSRVQDAILKIGFPEWRVRVAWLRYGSPTIPEALGRLIEGGCSIIYWMPSTYVADGVNTLYDIPSQMEDLAARHNVKLVSLGAWNADSLAAQEIAARVRAATRTTARG